MSARRLFLAATLAVSSITALPAITRAQDAPAAEKAEMAFTGTINSSAVNVRSGPGDNYYATDRLEQGATVSVVGARFDWLKITPPQGSFSYVAKAYVTRFADGSKGRVEKPDLRVRAGSSQNAMKTTVQTTLNVGDEVNIIGEVDEYYKVTPPSGVFLYVHKQFVTANKLAEVAAKPAETPKPEVKPEAVKPAEEPKVTSNEMPNKLETPTKTETPLVAAAPATQPSTEVASAPAAQPSAPSAESIFDKLESGFAELSRLPLDQQPLAETITAYESITASELPESLKRIVDVRLATLKARKDACEQMLALKKSHDAAGERQLALKAEQQELEDRIKKAQLSMYTAVGTLRTSSLQQGQTMLYRLTDPATGRTIVYLRSNEAEYGKLLGQFIGVHGPVSTDAQLAVRVITPTDAMVVDPAKINNGVAAQMMPPSMLTKVTTAQ